MRSGGVPPKLGEKLGHRARRPVEPGDGQPKQWRIPAGDWSPEAVRWWKAATSSLASKQAWLDEDRPKLERLLWMVNTWWAMTATSPTEAMRMADNVRRAETELYLGPAERARAGLTPEKSTPETQVGSTARARLQAAG